MIITEKGTIVCVAVGKGRTHDSRLFKESKTRLHPDLILKTDSGYQGIRKLHEKSRVPHKRSKKNRCPQNKTPITAASPKNGS